jgi:hypothetical protein
MWTLAYGYHEDRAPTLGYEPTREAAMAAFAKSRRRTLPLSGKPDSEPTSPNDRVDGAEDFRLPRHQGWCRIEWLLHCSGAATPQRAIASCDEWQAVFIARPVGVVRQLEFLFHGFPALAFLRLLLDLG